MNRSVANSENNDKLLQFYDASLSQVELLSATRYSNERFIAEGAIKSVSRVTDNHCSRDVAMARIKDDVLDLEQAIDFIREIQTTSGFEHPNIIRVYDMGITEGAPWFTMELTSGKTLNDKIREAPSLPEKMEIFIQLCDAIAYAHQHDVLHLDLKPNNISLGKQGQIMLGDWGLASSIAKRPVDDLEKSQTQQGYIKGSPGFMAPEKANPEYTKHPSSDIFGLGAILYFLLTGEAPIEGANQQETLDLTRKGKIQALNRPEIPSRLTPLLSKAMASDPAERYHSAAELKREAEQYRDGFATLAESASPVTLAALFFKRNKTTCILALSSIVALLASTAYYIHSLQASEQRAIGAQAKAEHANSMTTLAMAELLNEQEARQKANEELSSILQIHSGYELDQLDFDKALQSAKQSVDSTPDNPNALYTLGFTHFVRQEFRLASNNLKQSGLNKAETLIKLSDQYASIPGPLSGNETVQLIKKLGKQRVYISLSMLHYDAKIKSNKEHCKLIHYFLKKYNKPSGRFAPPLQFHYSEKNRTANLSGNPDGILLHSKKTNLTPPVHLLSSLPVRALILDDTVSNRRRAESLKTNSKCKIIFVNPDSHRRKQPPRKKKNKTL
ncbi:serine/threonine protein kinase [Verrucomicrobiaceae bacterium N1E253]|uniref:Serine/threonine protein kinase n=1 Tax=Oceaniferula marina TaxID=2748318 RepID=A0A851GCR0_9BACT|nr:serine/threonine-protein kinase [Oceaniferula marina]NWK54722.1 serine/threonine protein kinase [Oceaniferula marina]